MAKQWIANPETWTYHIVRMKQFGASYRTLCGKLYVSTPVDGLPGNVKSCEMCLRLDTWHGEHTGETP